MSPSPLLLGPVNGLLLGNFVFGVRADVAFQVVLRFLRFGFVWQGTGSGTIHFISPKLGKFCNGPFSNQELLSAPDRNPKTIFLGDRIHRKCFPPEESKANRVFLWRSAGRNSRNEDEEIG